MLRTVVQGRRRDIGLGGLSVVSLAEAREEAAAMRKVARLRRRPDRRASGGATVRSHFRGGGATCLCGASAELAQCEA